MEVRKTFEPGVTILIKRGKYLSIVSDPYPFFSDLKMGVSYTQPMYNDVVNPDDPLAIPTKEFYGVWAVDYSLAQLTDFLTSQYNSTEMWVVVVETEFPHYVIAASTGSPASVKRMGGDLNTPCPEGATEEDGCQVVRVPIDVLGAETNLAGDIVLKRGFTAYQESGYPDVTELVGFKESETVGVQAFVGQGHIYEQNDASNLQWYVMVAMPMARSIEDAVLSGTSGFVIVCVLATIGVVGCFSLFLILMEKRNEEAFINGDWRFTSAFILGCSALNLSTYTLLGDNTGATCKLRMWFFNGLFALGELYGDCGIPLSHLTFPHTSTPTSVSNVTHSCEGVENVYDY